MTLQCGIVGLPNVGKSTLFNALTKAGIAAENYPFCTIEPNVGIVEVPDPRLDKLAAIAKPEKVRPGDRRVRRHRGPGRGRLEGRGPRQPVPRQHPRDRRHRQRGALLRGRQRHPRRGQGRPDLRHRGDPDRAGAGRPGSRSRRRCTSMAATCAPATRRRSSSVAAARARRRRRSTDSSRCARWASPPTRCCCCSRCSCSPRSRRCTSPTSTRTASRTTRSSSA